MRKQGYHFTPEEIARIRAAFDTGVFPEDIASDLECSTRIINTYYRKFRGGSPGKKGPRQVVPPVKPRARPNLYTCSFEL